ncbi:hypothetical protein JCGZ_25684 [Jatropha curcas]|uniref:Uncharacterized protein n=1 Tax=Jatropha curcas TaxID=180498 RepID=A0A067LQG7_JATCU|nr:hypothetical protein JCGZ_25684 [Jatropha curcas]
MQKPDHSNRSQEEEKSRPSTRAHRTTQSLAPPPRFTMTDEQNKSYGFGEIVAHLGRHFPNLTLKFLSSFSMVVDLDDEEDGGLVIFHYNNRFLKDTGRVLQDDSFILWCVAKKIQVDVAFFLCQHLKSEGKASNGDVVIGGLISHLCKIRPGYFEKAYTQTPLPV